jgi:hypothetical protein
MTKNSPPLVSPSIVAPSSQLPPSSRGFSISVPPTSESPVENGYGDLKTPTRPMKSPNGSFNADGIFGNGRGQRNSMTQSDTERENAVEDGMELGPSHETRPNPKKRPSSDAIEYPRRRATIAV